MEPKKRENPPVSEDGTVLYTSATQMQLVENCPTKWFLKYKLGYPDYPVGKGAERGTEGHARIEEYLTSGAPILDQLEMLGVHRGLVPPPGPGLLVEQPTVPGYDVLGPNQLWNTKPVAIDGVPLVGFIDLINMRTLAVDGVLRLTDWKFKKSIAKYGAHGPDLINPNTEAGLQMVSYLVWILANRDLFPGLQRVRVAHVTFQTQGVPTVEEAFAEADLQSIGKICETVSRRIVPALKAIAATKSVTEVKRNEDYCHMYPPKGCAYKAICPKSTSSKITAGLRTLAARKTGAVPMSMLSTILKPSAAPAVATTAPPAMPIPIQSATPAPVAAPAPAATKLVIHDDGVNPEIEAQAAVQGERYRIGPAIGTFLCNFPGPDGLQSSFLNVEGGPPLLVPASTKVLKVVAAPVAPVAPPAPPPAPVAPVVTTEAPAAAAPVVPSNPAAGTAPTVAPTTVAEVAPAAKPKKAKKEPEVAPAPVTIAPPAPTAVGQYAGVYLYFGCAPVGVPTSTLFGFVNEVQKAVVQAGIESKPEYKDLDPETDLRTGEGPLFGFGKWKAWIEAGARETAIAPGHYLVTPGDERVEAVARALLASLPPGHAVIGGR